MSRKTLQILIFIAWASCLASAAVADRLVTADGETIETKGPWKVKGRTVVFTDDKGALRSLRLDDVDLEASEAATAASALPEPAAEPAATEAETRDRKPVMVLTNADVARGTSDRPAGRLSVIMYSTTSCGYCRKARKLFGELGVTFIDKDVEHDTAALREALQKTGGRTGVPIFDFAGTIFIGYGEKLIREQLVRLGYPVELEE